MASLKFPIDFGSSYNFTLLVPAILGAGFSGALLSGVLDYNSAITLADVTAKHAAALPQLPVGTPSDPKKLLYLKLTTTTGATEVIAQDWVAVQPELVVSTQAVVTVSNISTNDIARLREVLTSNGFASFTIA